MGERQISDRQRRWLAQELDAWRLAGIIDEARSGQIANFYESAALHGARKQSIARSALQAIAAVLIGLAVLLLVGYNWEQLPRAAKLVLVFGTILATYALAFYLRWRTSARRVADVVFLLGCLFYGAGIWLVAQVFHLDSHYPNGVWWWAVGVLPFALCLDTLLLHLLLVALLAMWAGMEVINFPHLNPWWLWPWWANGAYSLPVLAAPGMLWAYRRGSPLTLAFYVALLAWWIVLLAIAWDLEWQSLYLIGALGALFWIVAENHPHGSLMAVPYRYYGTLLLGGALVPPSFVEFQRTTRSWNRFDPPLFAEMVLMVMVLSILVAFGMLLRPLGAERPSNPFSRLIAVFRQQWVPAGMAFWMALMALSSYGGAEGRLAVTVMANVAMIVFAIFLMRVGLREERGRLFSAGVAYFLLWAICRYVDLFGDKGGMLGAAMMFLACGAALFGLAAFWGRRKEAGYVG